ncbi:MAG TPA: alcohol dehydrogenase catalytic domain-containing protein, partial [Polyangia bacterium]|nr:alcohol dehydrogenase catalytic domain-containing protein [Polyangia bacterium]
MPNAIVIHEVGGPEQLRFEGVPDPVPGPGQVRIRQSAIGLNFIDVYLRTGLYKAPALPFIPGQEGAGVVEALGPGVTEVAVGDRVAYAGVNGAYAEIRVLPAERLVHLPDGVDDRTAAAMMLKGMTAEYLLFRCARVQAGDTILFHAAAGGVGSIACQWGRALGLRVIG